MPTHTIHTRANKEPVQASEPKSMARSGEVIAKTVAFIGGASLLIGGALGYAFGYLEGLREKGDRHEV